MTTLADVGAGETFLFAVQCTAIDAAGYHLDLYGPQRALAGSVTVGPDGTFTGGLAAAPAGVPVQLVTGFAPVSTGDVLSDAAGNTMVARSVRVGPDGAYTWANRPDFAVAYPAAGWTVIGHVDL